MARTKVLEELRCDGCDRKLSAKKPLYETAWSGCYWCGRGKCAIKIMEDNCLGEELDVNDDCNREDVY